MRPPCVRLRSPDSEAEASSLTPVCYRSHRPVRHIGGATIPHRRCRRGSRALGRPVASNRRGDEMPAPSSPKPTPHHRSERITPPAPPRPSQSLAESAGLRGVPGALDLPRVIRRTIDGGVGARPPAPSSRARHVAPSSPRYDCRIPSSPTDQPVPHRRVPRVSCPMAALRSIRAQAGHMHSPNASSPQPGGIHQRRRLPVPHDPSTSAEQGRSVTTPPPA